MKSKGIFTRILSAILCAIMIIGMVPVAIAAEGEALALEVGTVELTLDDSAVDGYYTVNVPINVTANTGFNALKFAVTYNEALELIGWTNGTVMSDTHNHTPAVENATSLSPFTVTYGNITGAQNTAQNSTATGKLIELQFKVAATVAAGTNLPVSVAVSEAYVQGDALDPDPITASVTAGGVTTVAANTSEVGVVYGKDLTTEWGLFYTDKANNPTKNIVGNSIVVTASNAWQHDGSCGNFSIKNVPVAAGVNGTAEEAPNHLNVDIMINARGAAKYANVGTVIVKSGTKSRSYDIDFSGSKAGVTRYQFNISNFGEISTIDAIEFKPYIQNGGQFDFTTIEIASVSYSYKEIQKPVPIIYEAHEITNVTIANPTSASGLNGNWSSAYDYERDLWVINFNKDIKKTASEDGDRVKISFPAVPADANLPYVAIGVQIPSKTADWDFNVFYAGKRTWNAGNAAGSIGTTGMGKLVKYLAQDTTNYGTAGIDAVAVNAWGQAAFSAPKGEAVYVQYIAFFETLDEANAYVYENTLSVKDLDDGNDETETDYVAFTGKALDDIVSPGGLVTDETGSYVDVDYTSSYVWITPTTDYLPASGPGAWSDYRYHVFVYKASNLSTTDGLNITGSKESWGNQDFVDTKGEIKFHVIDLYSFTGNGVGAITNAYTNLCFRSHQFTNANSEFDLYSVASFRTMDQVNVYKSLYYSGKIAPDTATVSLADGSSSIIAGDKKIPTYKILGREDRLPITSDATAKSVVYTVDNDCAEVMPNGYIKALKAGNVTLTATITLTNNEVITAETEIEIKANSTPVAIYRGDEITAIGQHTITSFTSVVDPETGNLLITLPGFTGHDNARLTLQTPDVAKTAPFIAYGVRIENALRTMDNVNILVTSTIAGKNVRLYDWNLHEFVDHTYSATGIKKFITNASGFTNGDTNIDGVKGWDLVGENDVIKGIILNPWYQGTNVVPAGSEVEVQYIAYFETLEEAQNYVYIEPTKYEVTFMVNGNVYKTIKVFEGKNFTYPEVDPVISGLVFAGWDVAEGAVNDNMVVNAVFSTPKVYDFNSSELTVLASGEVSLTKVKASATDSPYFRFTAGTDLPEGKDQKMGTRNDGSYAQVKFSDFGSADVKTNDVFVICYRSNLSGAGTNLNPMFPSGRLWSGSVGSFTAGTEWHKYVVDLSAANFKGGQLPTNNWEWAIENERFIGIQFRPYETIGQIKQEGGYFDVKYVGFFDSVEAANAYEYIETTYHEVKFVADGEVFYTAYIADGNTLAYPAGEPTPPAGYKFVKWNAPTTTVVTGNLTVNAVFALGSSVAADTIRYGNALNYELGSIYQSTIEYSDTTAIFRPDTNGTKDTNWANNGCALLTANGLNIPTTHKYLVIGMTTYVDKATYPNYNGSSTQNVELYVDSSNKGYIDVDLASHVGTELYAHVVDASSLVTSGTAITNIRFDPILNKNKGGTDANSRYGTGGHFRLGFIAAFKTLEDAEAYAATYNTVAENVEVTVTATEGGSVIGTGGQYAVGSRLILTAVPAEGYVLDGWYLNAAEEAVSTDTTFTHTVSAATTIEARFVKAINKTVAKLEIENVEDDSLGSITVSGAIVGDNYVASGTAVQITATPKEEVGVFGYWKRTVSTSGISVYLGIDESLDAYALGTGVFYQPVFYPAGTTGEVLYVDATNVIIEVDPETGKPVAPTKPGYTFSGNWKVREANGVVTVMEPIYTINDSTTSTLNVYAANGVATSYAPSFNEVVTLDAGANNVVWTLKIGTKSYPVSYNREYSFRYRITAASATLTATVTSDAPKALVSGIEAVHADAATRFIGSYYVPESYTVTGYGMLLTSDKAVAEDMILETPGIIVGNIATATNEDSMMFVVNKNNTLKNSERTTWYGRAFLMYTDGTESHVIYGETISK